MLLRAFIPRGFVVLSVGLVVSILPALRPQAPATLRTFLEIQRKATEAREAKQLEEAVQLYRQGLMLRPGWDEGTWYLGTSLYGLKRYAEARDAFLSLTASQPGNGQAWALAGMCEFELRNYSQALDDLSHADSAGIGQNDTLASLVDFRIALLQIRGGQFEEATDRLVPFALAGTYPQVIEALGLSVLRVRLVPSEIPDQDRDLYMRAGKAMDAYLTHDTEGAARLFSDLVAAYPSRPGVHYARGKFLVESDPAEALVEFQRELDLAPWHPNALLRVTDLYLKQGAANKALPYARRAVQASPDLAVAHRFLGQALFETGDDSDAIQELKTAVHLAPDNPQTHFLMARAYKQTGNTSLADKELAEFQRLEEIEEAKSGSAGTQK